MNLNRKCERLERIIRSKEIQIENLTLENEALRSENRELLYKQSQYKLELDAAKDLREHYMTILSDLREIKNKYQQAIFDAQNVKKEYTKKFKTLMRQIKK